MWFKKKISVPVDNSTKTIEVLETWVVSWESYKKDYTYVSEKQMEFIVFTNEQEANDFKASLEAAAKLLNDSNRKITIEKR